MKKGCDCMLATNAQQVIEPTDTTKLEFYRLIGEGYKAMQDGRTSTIDEVREKLKKGERNVASVVFTEPAEYDLLDIEYYIFVDLCNPQAAQRISDGILDAAEKLSEYPTGHPLVDDELLRSVGLRMTRFDNYNIFYYYDMQNDVVYIIRVLYNKVDWQSLFKR